MNNMKILFLQLLIAMLLCACGATSNNENKVKPPSAAKVTNTAKTRVDKGKQNKGVDTKEKAYWTKVKEVLEINDDQIKKLQAVVKEYEKGVKWAKEQGGAKQTDRLKNNELKKAKKSKEILGFKKYTKKQAFDKNNKKKYFK